ncbi:hypothetical protein TCON_1708 [Astathelohania contejeani]|uniref:Uncharacterized protein n=1 Tax=Astathelohania contejeani TaxID=164912 RepID=A0ABQ7HY09_9MICR|nr:hypothetical protein TCON_1708 [Thelohania contejeani]
MKRITDYVKKPKETKKEINYEPIKTYGKICYDLAYEMSKYDSRFRNLGCGRWRYTVKGVHWGRTYKKHLEKTIVYHQRLPFEGNMECFKNLIHLTIQSSSKFNLLLLYQSKVKILTLIEVDVIEIDMKFNRYLLGDTNYWLDKLYDLNITVLEISRSSIYFDDLLQLMKIKNLSKISLNQIKLLHKIEFKNDKYLILEQIKKMNKLTFLELVDFGLRKEDAYSLMCLVPAIDIKIKETDFSIEYFRNMLLTSHLRLINCDLNFFSIKFSDVEELEIRGLGITTMKDINSLGLCNLKICKFRYINIDSNDFIYFLKANPNIVSLDISGVALSHVVLYDSLKYLSESLRYLDVSEIELPTDFIPFVKRNLKDCKVIYLNGKELNVNRLFY